MNLIYGVLLSIEGEPPPGSPETSFSDGIVIYFWVAVLFFILRGFFNER